MQRAWPEPARGREITFDARRYRHGIGDQSRRNVARLGRAEDLPA
jgi:hypothetical protein